jgi:hypothetical protein
MTKRDKMFRVDNLIQQVRSRWQSPIIGIIGATIPTEEYTRGMGIEVGYAVREHLSEAGSVFTGGVDGVGVDAYAGIMKYCIDQGLSKGRLPEDRFFVLIPHYFMMGPPRRGIRRQARVEYDPPQSYAVLAALSKEGKLSIERAGSTMDERREFVAGIADKLVVVNGGSGTLDEAINALEFGKPIITLPYTYGAASIIALAKKGKISPAMRHQLWNSRLSFDNVDLSNILVADSIRDMRKYL